MRRSYQWCMGAVLSLSVLGVVAWPAPPPAQAGNAAPPAVVQAFAPLGAGRGWVLSAQALYWTENHGQTWATRTPVAYPPLTLATATFVGDTGWLVWVEPDAIGQPTYTLAHSTDAGQQWATRPLKLFAPNAPEAAAAALHLQFLPDGQTGWLSIKRATSQNFSLGTLFRTTDGGASWEQLAQPVGDAPFFTTATAGTLTGGPMGDAHYTTQDGGRTWQTATFQPTPTPFANAIAWAWANPAQQAGWAQTQIGARSGARSGTFAAAPPALWHTTDGGYTWAPLPLPLEVPLFPVFPAFPTVPSVPASPAPAARTQPYFGQAFDICNLPTVSSLQAWLENSPYKVVNLYIGGISRGCSNPEITASNLALLAARGWRFIPTWVGPQAACSSYPNRIDADPVVARTQGQAEANAAANVALNLGLATNEAGTVIYYDIEAYSHNATTACRESTKAFIAGWVEQLHTRASIAGVYGSTCGSYLSDFASLGNNVPDAIWAAVWLTPAQYRPEVTVWNLPCLSNTLWVSPQRLRQYAGDHWETWGGVSLNIDSNVLEGPVAAPAPAWLRLAPAIPEATAAAQWWFPWLEASSTRQSEVVLSNPHNASVTITVQLPYSLAVVTLAPNTMQTVTFANVITGPVQVQSNGLPILATLRTWATNTTPLRPTVLTPASQPLTPNLPGQWWLPFYDSAAANTHAIHLGNPGTQEAVIDVFLAGQTLYTMPITLAPNRLFTVEVDGARGGPLQVFNRTGGPIWAASRQVATGSPAFTTLPGTSATALASTWWFPWAGDTAGLTETLWVGNPQTLPLTVTVALAQTPLTTTVIPAQSVWAWGLENVPSGALNVTSADGQGFYVQRTAQGAIANDFYGQMGVATTEAAATWWLPWYDATLNGTVDELIITNPGAVTATLTATVNGVGFPGFPRTLAPGQTLTATANIKGGPVWVNNLTGLPLVVGQRTRNPNWAAWLGLPQFERALNERVYLPMVWGPGGN